MTVLFFAEMMLSVLMGAMSLCEATVFVEYIDVDEVMDATAGLFYLGYGCIGLLYLPVILTCVVLFCVWVYRANKNVRTLGAQGMEYSPGWCVGSFFVPILNLVIPYKAVREIYQASDPEADPMSWKNSLVSPVVGWWWGLWILSGILGQMEFRMAMSNVANVLVMGAWLGVLSGALAIPNALLAIRVVRSIHDRQERKAANMLQVIAEPRQS